MAGEHRLSGQIVLVLGGSCGIGLETARRARVEGADVILTAREPNRLHRVGLELGASIAAFDLSHAGRLARFFANLPKVVDHVLVSGGAPGVERIALCVRIARLAEGAVRPTGSLVFLGRDPGCQSADPLVSAANVAMPALARSVARELAPIRVNVVAPGFVDRACSDASLGEALDPHREQLRPTLPGGRLVSPDVAALAIDLMTNTAVTGGTFDIDGGQQLIEP